MQQFKYTAINLQKQRFSGTFIAKDERDLAAQLVKQNLYLVSCSTYSGDTPSAFFTSATGKVSVTELTTFCRQFAIMITAGISVLECLELLKDQPFSTFFRSILKVIYDDVKSGVMLSEALNKHNKVFPDFFRSMIFVGEASGKMDLVFASLADYYEKDMAIKKKVKSAFSYPIILAIMTVGIVILMLGFVVPSFRNTLSSLEVEVTGITKVIYDASEFLTNNWLYILAAVVVIVMAIIIVGRTEKGAFFYDKMKRKIPVFRKVQEDLIASRFARGFSLLLSSGMEVADALDAVAVVIGNRDATAQFRLASEEVKHGMTMAAAFEKYKIFPRLMLQMIAVGERTAEVEDVLNRSRKFFDDQVEDSLTSLTSKIQPIMLVIMGLVIGAMFVAVYAPMITIMQNLG